ncbi:MAG: hypothetical protein GY809_03990, partial [Planctomycetes bacterium]|nr:hypothetical protein [Planctomycetota bacterium]
MIERNSVVAESNELIAALLLTRSEAIKRETNTLLISTASGWNSFVDDDNDGVQDAGEDVLTSHTVNNSNISLAANGDVSTGVGYGPTGRATNGSLTDDDGTTDYYKLERGDAPTRCIRFSLTGRPWVDKDSSEGGGCS